MTTENDLYENVVEDGEKCNGCQWNRETVDKEPYGDRTVDRLSRECIVPDIDMCPAVKDLLRC